MYPASPEGGTLKLKTTELGVSIPPWQLQNVCAVYTVEDACLQGSKATHSEPQHHTEERKLCRRMAQCHPRTFFACPNALLWALKSRFALSRVYRAAFTQSYVRLPAAIVNGHDLCLSCSRR